MNTTLTIEITDPVSGELERHEDRDADTPDAWAAMLEVLPAWAELPTWDEQLTRHDELLDAEVRQAIRSGAIQYAGHAGLRIFGRLDCSSGRRRMARRNRVFFGSELEARAAGFRPCARCMRAEYEAWKRERGRA